MLVGSTLPVAETMGGLLDDLACHGGSRGLRGHLRSLLAKKPTTGVAKGLALVLAGNVANCLDLRPGRAGKAFLAAGAGLAVWAAASGRSGEVRRFSRSWPPQPPACPWS